MSIPASNIVAVTPRTISAGASDLEIVGLIITENPLCPFPGGTAYTSASAVGTAYGTGSDEYAVAVKYFLGYDNSFKKPSKLYLARAAKEGLAASLIGGACGSLAELKAVTDGAFTIEVDGEEKTVSGLDLSSITTQSDAAEIIAEAIGGVDVAYSSVTGGFIVTSETIGGISKVGFAADTTGTKVGETVVGEATVGASSDAATVLGLTEATGAVQSEGTDALTAYELMDSIKAHGANWVTFTTLYEADAEEAEGYAQWSNDQDVDFLYCGWTSQTADTLPTNSGNLPNTLAENDYEGVCLTYGDIYTGILPMAIAGSIDWGRVDGLPTFKFKQQDGLAASCVDETTAANLESMKVNWYGRYASRADEFTCYAPGCMLGGDYDWIDPYLGMVWLKNKIQTACLSGFLSVGRVPYNDAGYTIIRAWLTDPINAAKTNGVIQSGVSLNESQKATLISEIGEDVSSTIYTDGYYCLISDPGATARQNRESPTIGIWYTYAGAVHKLDIPLTLVK